MLGMSVRHIQSRAFSPREAEISALMQAYAPLCTLNCRFTGGGMFVRVMFWTRYGGADQFEEAESLSTRATRQLGAVGGYSGRAGFKAGALPGVEAGGYSAVRAAYRGGAQERGRGDAHLRGASDQERGGADCSAAVGGGLDHAPGHQRSGGDSRLGIRLRGRFD